MELIHCNKISKKYTMNGLTVTALNGIDLMLQTGEFTAIAGPSGSGKTTLLNIIGGLDAASSGTIALGKTRLNELSPRSLADLRLKRIGFVFQAYNLIPVLSALENVEYILLLQGMAKDERQEKAKAVLTDVGLEKELHRRPHELSGGQQQRVAVARAIVSEPEVVLADEPTANLDQKTGEHLLRLMENLNREKGITFLFSTHDPMVMNRSRRLITLLDGTIITDEKKTA